jgi:hypothetical protein
MAEQPSPVVRLVASGLVGLIVTLVAAKLFGKRAAPVVAALAVVAHEKFDAPLANVIAEVVY